MRCDAMRCDAMRCEAMHDSYASRSRGETARPAGDPRAGAYERRQGWGDGPTAAPRGRGALRRRQGGGEGSIQKWYTYWGTYFPKNKSLLYTTGRGVQNGEAVQPREAEEAEEVVGGLVDRLAAEGALGVHRHARLPACRPACLPARLPEPASAVARLPR